MGGSGVAAGNGLSRAARFVILPLGYPHVRLALINRRDEFDQP